MQKVFAKRLKETTFSFFEDDINHLKNVLRMQINDKLICIFEQMKYLTKIVSLDPFLSEIIEIIPDKSEFNNVCLTLFQAVIKPKHFEWILSKATELQVDEIVPVFFERSQKQNLIKQNRMEAIVYSSAKQCNRINIPLVSNLFDFKQVILKSEKLDLLIIPYENEENLRMSEGLDKKKNLLINKDNLNIGILIGPEGGFSSFEIEQLKSLPNVLIVGLSKTILRSDTASFYSLSVLIDYLIKLGY